jgi:hypothetical protein
MGSLIIGIASSLIAAALITGVGLFFSIPLRRWVYRQVGQLFGGIEYVFVNARRAQPEVESELGAAKFIKLVTGRGNELQRETFSSLLANRPASRRTEFQVLLPIARQRGSGYDWTKQREDEIAQFDHAFGSGFLGAQIETTMRFLSQYEAKGVVKLRFYDAPHIGRILITDRCVFFTPYSRTQHGRDCPVIKYGAQSDMYNFYMRYFEQLWECAAPSKKPEPNEIQVALTPSASDALVAPLDTIGIRPSTATSRIATIAELFRGTWQLRFESKSSDHKGVELFIIRGDLYSTNWGSDYKIKSFSSDLSNGRVFFDKEGIDGGKRSAHNSLQILDRSRIEGEEVMTPGGEVYKVEYCKVADIASSTRPVASDILIGKWTHKWEGRAGTVAIDREMNYSYEGDGVGSSGKDHFTINNPKYSGGFIYFRLKDAEDGTMGLTQILNVVNGNQLLGHLEGEPQKARIYERTN